MRTAFLAVLAATAAATVGKPVISKDISNRTTTSPNSCFWYCYLNGTITNSEGQVLEQFADSPGCSDCAGSTCSGKLDGEWILDGNMFIGDYWVSGCVVSEGADV